MALSRLLRSLLLPILLATTLASRVDDDHVDEGAAGSAEGALLLATPRPIVERTTSTEPALDKGDAPRDNPSHNALRFQGKWCLSEVSGQPEEMAIALGVGWIKAKAQKKMVDAAVMAQKITSNINVWVDDEGKDVFEITSVTPMGTATATWTVNGHSYSNKNTGGTDYSIAAEWEGDVIVATMDSAKNDGATARTTLRRSVSQDDKMMFIESTYQDPSAQGASYQVTEIYSKVYVD